MFAQDLVSIATLVPRPSLDGSILHVEQSTRATSPFLGTVSPY